MPKLALTPNVGKGDLRKQKIENLCAWTLTCFAASFSFYVASLCPLGGDGVLNSNLVHMQVNSIHHAPST